MRGPLILNVKELREGDRVRVEFSREGALEGLVSFVDGYSGIIIQANDFGTSFCLDSSTWYRVRDFSMLAPLLKRGDRVRNYRATQERAVVLDVLRDKHIGTCKVRFDDGTTVHWEISSTSRVWREPVDEIFAER